MTDDNRNGTEVLDLVPAQRQGLADVDPLAIIERRNKMLERLLDYAIKSTHPGQWVDQQGKPFPTAAAAEVMARRCAVRISNVRSRKIDSSDDRGPFYFYLVEATASLPGEWDSLEAMGTCSSRDQFLGTETSSGRQLSDIDEGNILKAAYSNLLVNAVTRLLGVRNLTWEMLASLGIDQSGAAKVEYRNGAKGGGQGRSGGDLELKWGRAKGQMLSSLPDKDVQWYMGAWEKDLGDPEKAKFHGNCRKSLEIAKAILAQRAADQTAPGGEAAGNQKSAYQKILAAAAASKKTEEQVKEWLKARGRASSASVTDEDVAAFEQWAAERTEAGWEG